MFYHTQRGSMQKVIFFTLTSLFYALFFSACNETTLTTKPFQIAKSPLAQEQNPQVTDHALQVLSHANNRFTFDLYTDKDNQVYSAYSLFGLLHMLSAGAQAETKSQILHALHLQDTSHNAFNALNKALTSQQESFHILSNNALWMQKGFEVKEPFLDTLGLHYGAAVHILDFQKDSKAATDTINHWVSMKTKSLIPNLLPDNALDAQTRLILTNTLYLKGDWVHKFPQQRTLYKNFTLLNGAQTQVQTMHQENTFGYQEINGTQVLSMAYHDSDYALLSMMPEVSKFADFKLEDFTIMIDSLKPTPLDLYYPRYTFSSKRNFIAALKQRGMHDAFTQDADFSRISDQPLFISQIVQQTHISVDENGTEAAAATAVTIGTTSIPAQAPLKVRFDHPFLFALYHMPSKTILFYGQVLNPSNQ